MKEHPNPSCVVKVGECRGFIVEHRVKIHRLKPLSAGVKLRSFRKLRLVVTAAHCLPHLPPPHAASFTEERTYRNLLGKLDECKGSIAAECLFVDPVADVAVLGSPDNQNLPDDADAYDELTQAPPALRIRNARSGSGWVLSLDRRWIRTALAVVVGVRLEIDATKTGMSGSPVLNDNGEAVGVVVIGGRPVGQPILTLSLPGRFLRAEHWKM